MHAPFRMKAAAICLLLSSCGEDPPTKVVSDDFTETTPACELGGPLDGSEKALNTSYEILDAPNGQRIKNEKASEIFGKSHYHQIDTSTTVVQLCASEGWTMVQIKSPDWLNHVKGWAPDSIFRDIERNKNDKRIYVEQDVIWSSYTTPYKKQILEQINRISMEPGCDDIDPSSIDLSPSRSTPNKPVFFVTCGMTGTPYNIWFEPFQK